MIDQRDKGTSKVHPSLFHEVDDDDERPDLARNDHADPFDDDRLGAALHIVPSASAESLDDALPLLHQSMTYCSFLPPPYQMEHGLMK